MTPDNLEELVKTRITEVLKDILLINKDGEYSSVNVTTGLLPPKNWKIISEDSDGNEVTEDYQEFPFVLLRTLSGEDISNEKSSVHIKAIIGVALEEQSHGEYNIEPFTKGHKDLLSIINRIRRDFLSNPIFGNCSLQFPFKWEIDEEQPLKNLYGSIEINFKVPGISNEL